MSDHNSLVQRAKQSQKEQLATSSALSEDLAKTVSLIVSSSEAEIQSKYSTILQLDKQIDAQLMQTYEDFSGLHQDRKSLTKLLDRLTTHTNVSENTNKLQARIEKLDQNLRILEQTLKSVKETRQ